LKTSLKPGASANGPDRLAGADERHLPYTTPIEAYGRGGFRFAGMSHRGSLLCLPDGLWAWPVARPDDLTEASLGRVFERADDIGLFLLGTGAEPWALPRPLLMRFLDTRISVETMRTGAAVSTYNILIGEGRRVAAGLIAVD
jgi:uncharacterized protein